MKSLLTLSRSQMFGAAFLCLSIVGCGSSGGDGKEDGTDGSGDANPGEAITLGEKKEYEGYAVKHSGLPSPFTHSDPKAYKLTIEKEMRLSMDSVGYSMVCPGNPEMEGPFLTVKQGDEILFTTDEIMHKDHVRESDFDREFDVKKGTYQVVVDMYASAEGCSGSFGFAIVEVPSDDTHDDGGDDAGDGGNTGGNDGNNGDDADNDQDIPDNPSTFDFNLVGTWEANEVQGPFTIAQSLEVTAGALGIQKVKVNGDDFLDYTATIETPTGGEYARMILTVKEIRKDDSDEPLSVGDTNYCIYKVDRSVTPATFTTNCSETGVAEYPTNFDDAFVMTEAS